MKREDLKAMGLTDEQVDSILNEHHKSVGKLNNRVTELEENNTGLSAQLKTAEKNYKELKKSAGENEELQTKLDEMTQVHKDETSALKQKVKETQTSSAIKLALHGKTHDVDLVTGLIDTKKLVIGDDGNITAGLDEQLKTLQESKSFLFIQETGKEGQTDPQAPATKSTFNGVAHASGAPGVTGKAGSGVTLNSAIANALGKS